MANISSQEWCDLIFEGKNKAYGAYDLRKDSPKRHNLAVLIVFVLTVVGFYTPTIIKAIFPAEEKKANAGLTEQLYITELDNAQLEEEEMEETPPPPPVDVPPPPPLKSSIKFTAPVITPKEEVKEEDEIKSQDELAEKEDIAISVADIEGVDTEDAVDFLDAPDPTPVVEEVVEDNQVYTSVEQKPAFPGGDKALLQYISENIKYPSIAQENGIQGRVVVQFVVEKNGSVGQVNVVRSIDATLDKEAIRVVKSLPKFVPGKQNGHPVRVWYTLPVQFKLT